MFSLYIPTTIPPKFTGACFLCQQYTTKCPVLATMVFIFQYCLFDFYLSLAFFNNKKNKWYVLQCQCQETNSLIQVLPKLLEKLPLLQGLLFQTRNGQFLQAQEPSLFPNRCLTVQQVQACLHTTAPDSINPACFESQIHSLGHMGSCPLEQSNQKL